LSKIGDQVSQLLLQAKKDSESKVKAELKVLNDAMKEMDTRLDALNRQLDEVEAEPRQAVEQSTVTASLAKLEQQWGKELGKLKQELHQTIFAHNHNADLMKHQKDALDQIRTEIESQKASPASERVKLAKDKLAKADALLKGQQKQRKLEPLFRRLTVLEQKLNCMPRGWPMGMMGAMGGMPPMGMPGMGQPPGVNMSAAVAAASRMPNPSAAAAWAGKGKPQGVMSQGGKAANAAELAAAAEERSALIAGLDKDDDEDGEDEDGEAIGDEEALES
jgi:hypothetical protein